MSFPYLEAHDICPDGMTRGSYSHVPTTLRTVNADHNAVEVHHSLFEGDRMSFFQVLTSRNNALDRMRPIRFYTEDPDDSGIKLFDGIITDTEYTYVGGDYMALRTNAVGWWYELARMNLHHPIEYDATWTVNEIYADLVRLANDRGVIKEAMYSYDTAKIPEYSTYSSYYEAATGTDFVVTNVYEGMKTLTRFLDATVPCPYEFGLRIEALPRTDGITQANTEDYIYILPFALNQDKAAAATLKRFQLAAGYEVRRSYKRLANDCLAIGNGYDTQQIRSTPNVPRTEITAAAQAISFTNDTLAEHYLKITAENLTAATEHIWIEVARIVPPSVTPTVVYETFPMAIPAGTIQTHFTSIRLAPEPDNAIKVHDFYNAVTPNYVTVEEVTNDGSPYHTSIAGKSRNTYGHAPHTITGLWLNTQARVDLIAGKHCRLYHAPKHELYAPIIARYVSYDNLIGNVANLYTPYEASLGGFLITDTVYGFRGKLITQHLMGMQYEFDWDYTDTHIYVMVGTDYVVVGTDKVVI